MTGFLPKISESWNTRTHRAVPCGYGYSKTPLPPKLLSSPKITSRFGLPTWGFYVKITLYSGIMVSNEKWATPTFLRIMAHFLEK